MSVLALAVLAAGAAAQVQPVSPSGFLPEDVSITGRQMHTFDDAGEPVAVVLGDFRLSVGRRSIRARDAVLWIRELAGGPRVLRQIVVYVEGDVQVTEGEGATTHEEAMLVTIRHEGALRASVDRHVAEPLSELPLYGRAKAVRQGLPAPRPAAPRAQAPGAPEPRPPATQPFTPELAPMERPVDPGALATVNFHADRWHSYQYFNEAGAVERVTIAQGNVYLGGQGPPELGYLEMHADSAVLFSADSNTPAGERPADLADRPGAERITEVYLEGDVRVLAGSRSMQAEQVLYDFVHEQAVILEAVVQVYHQRRNVPIVFRADRAIQRNRRTVEFEDVRLSTSQFRTPSYHIGASRATLEDLTAYDAAGEPAGEPRYRVELEHSTFNVEGVPVLYWPRAALDASMIEAPIRNAQVGDHGRFGFGAETSWYLFRTLGLLEPEGVDATFDVDVYERGTAFGIDADYDRSSSVGLLRAAGLWDRQQEDDFGTDRENIPAPEQRGRFLWRHKQYLPEDWQVQAEASYICDRNYLEEFYRQEFYAGKEQETLVYAEKQRDDWAITALVKGRVNDFQTTTEAWPDLGAHKIGQSAADDNLTLFGEAHVGALRYLPDDGLDEPSSDIMPRLDARGEAVAPRHWGPLNAAPFAFGRSGYWGQGTRDSDAARLIGGGGVRANMHFWRVFEDVNSRLLNLHRLRHIVTPEVLGFGAADTLPTSALYPLSPDIEPVESFQGAQVGVRQRWQTYRGPAEARHVSNVARLDVFGAFFNDTKDPNQPADGRMFFRRPEHSITRNAINGDAEVNLSDATSLLGSLNYDLNDTEIGRAAIGLSVQRDPRLRYHVGLRYIDDYSSSVATVGLDYQVNEKYQLTLFQQYDLDFEGGENLATEISIVRRFPRWYGAVTLVVDRAADDVGIVITFWPEGVPEFRLGGSRLGTWASSLLN